jgi:hypothetical protein
VKSDQSAHINYKWAAKVDKHPISCLQHSKKSKALQAQLHMSSRLLRKGPKIKESNIRTNAVHLISNDKNETKHTCCCYYRCSIVRPSLAVGPEAIAMKRGQERERALRFYTCYDLRDPIWIPWLGLKSHLGDLR